MTKQRIDTDKIKADTDLRELAGRYVVLERASASERSGPCPKCGGRDRFHCTATWFFCRQCHEKRGDTIEFMMWLNGCGFQEACELLGSGIEVAIPPSVRQPNRAVQRKWDSEDWQRSALHEVEAAIEALNGTEGEQGRRYLEGRGIQSDTWTKWRLGFMPNVQRRVQENGAWKTKNLGPAITVPWCDGRAIKAVQYRFIDQGEMRYWQKSGGDRTLFGLSLLAGRAILVVCEGEINAISVWQAAHDLVDVVSFGSESNLEHAADELRLLAQRYAHVLVWTDKDDRSLAALRIVGTAKPLQSPRGLDANDLLKKGVLRKFIERLLTKLGISIRIDVGEQRIDFREKKDETAEARSRLSELLGKPLVDQHQIAQLNLWADSAGVRVVWQRYCLDDPDHGWQSVS